MTSVLVLLRIGYDMTSFMIQLRISDTTTGVAIGNYIVQLLFWLV